MWILWWGERMEKTKQITLCAILLALALALSYAERFLPLHLAIPLPGIKLGLANIVTLLALYLFKTRYAFLILIPRCILGAIFGGGFTALVFSLCGGLLALGSMAAGKRIHGISVFGVSIMGAAAHNIGQILAAMALMRSVYVAGYLPYLLLVSVVTGLLTGSLCAGVLKVLPADLSKPALMCKQEN